MRVILFICVGYKKISKAFFTTIRGFQSGDGNKTKYNQERAHPLNKSAMWIMKILSLEKYQDLSQGHRKDEVTGKI